MIQFIDEIDSMISFYVPIWNCDQNNDVLKIYGMIHYFAIDHLENGETFWGHITQQSNIAGCRVDGELLFYYF